MAPTRRVLLLGASAVALTGGAGLAGLASAKPRDLVVELIQRQLPGVQLDRAATALCASDVLADLNESFQSAWLQREISDWKLKGVRLAGQTIGLDRVDDLGTVAPRLHEITRLAITRLLLNSNFFDLSDPRSAPIVYQRPTPGSACGNRFADLGPPR